MTWYPLAVSIELFEPIFGLKASELASLFPVISERAERSGRDSEVALRWQLTLAQRGRIFNVYETRPGSGSVLLISVDEEIHEAGRVLPPPPPRNVFPLARGRTPATTKKIAQAIPGKSSPKINALGVPKRELNETRPNGRRDKGE